MCKVKYSWICQIVTINRFFISIQSRILVSYWIFLNIKKDLLLDTWGKYRNICILKNCLQFLRRDFKSSCISMKYILYVVQFRYFNLIIIK